MFLIRMIKFKKYFCKQIYLFFNSFGKFSRNILLKNQANTQILVIIKSILSLLEKVTNTIFFLV